MSNVKPGDRAVVIKAALSSNIGKIVLVIEQYDGPAAQDNADLRPMWRIESLGGGFDVVNRFGVPVRTMRAVCPDAWLRRLADLDEPSKSVVRETALAR